MLRAIPLAGFLLLQACMSAVPTSTAGGLTPAGRTDIAVGGASTLPTSPASVAQREPASDAASVVPHIVLRHGLRSLDEAQWREAPADLDLSLTIMPGYGMGAVRLSLWEDRGSTSRYALVGGLSVEGGVLGDQGRALQPALGARVPIALTATIGSVVEAWVGAQGMGVYVASGQSEGSSRNSIFGVTGFVGLAAGLRNLHVLLELQGGLLSSDWFSGPWSWHWTPSFSLRCRL